MWSFLQVGSVAAFAFMAAAYGVVPVAGAEKVEEGQAQAALVAKAAPMEPAVVAAPTVPRSLSPEPTENSWEFTAPGGVPGFGPLSAADAEQLLHVMRSGFTSAR